MRICKYLFEASIGMLMLVWLYLMFSTHRKTENIHLVSVKENMLNHNGVDLKPLPNNAIREFNTQQIPGLDVYVISSFVVTDTSKTFVSKRVHIMAMVATHLLNSVKFICIFGSRPIRKYNANLQPLIDNCQDYIQSYRIICESPTFYISKVRLLAIESKPTLHPGNIYANSHWVNMELIHKEDTIVNKKEIQIPKKTGTCLMNSDWLKGYFGLPGVDQLLIYDKDIIELLSLKDKYKSKREHAGIHMDLGHSWFSFKFTIRNLIKYRSQLMGDVEVSLEALISEDCTQRLVLKYGVNKVI